MYESNLLYGGWKHRFWRRIIKDFNIVVCGEVKHGKSSLLNAIIGKELLPVNVREATCQVFRISDSPKESFELVFTDGHHEKIDLKGLVRYGSQTEIDAQGEPLLAGRVLRYIGIETPVAFIPPGVHLVDTPGLGATYAAHSKITLGVLKEADAVVFVTNSSVELTASQLDFLNEILSITKQVIIVLSKIDMVDEDNWMAIKKEMKNF